MSELSPKFFLEQQVLFKIVYMSQELNPGPFNHLPTKHFTVFCHSTIFIVVLLKKRLVVAGIEPNIKNSTLALNPLNGCKVYLALM